MKKVILLFALCSSLLVAAQDVTIGKSYIEITGTSETEVVPDELYLNITLLERMEGKEKITIDKQEADLKKHLKELGIDLSNLTLQNAQADYRQIRRKEKDVLISKSYILKVTSTDALSKVYERLDKMNAYDAYIMRYTNSKVLDFQKENRIKAIKAAKDKAEYVLAAIGQQVGAPILITETENYVEDGSNAYYQRMDKMMRNTVSMDGAPSAEESIGFKKIKMRAAFQVRFEIVKK